MLTLPSSHEVLGEALTLIAIRDPHSIVNKTYYAYDYAPTGDEVIATFTKLHGTPPKVAVYTDQDFEKVIEAGVVAATSSAGYRHAWGKGDWMWRGERIATEEGKSFEELARQFKK